MTNAMIERFTGRHNTFFLVGASLIAYLGMVWNLRLRAVASDGASLLAALGWYAVASGAFVGMLYWVERSKDISLRWIWLPALIFRLLFLLTEPVLSDDVYRYLWDGHLLANGVSPYAHIVQAPELDYLALPVRDLVNHSWMATPYMPAAQVIFGLLGLFLPKDPTYMQLVMILFDMAAAVVLAKLLILAGLPRRRVLLYLWNPLVIVEVAHGAHVDAWMNLLTVAGLYFSVENRHRFSSLFAPVMLALAALTKLVPVLLMPVLFWGWRWRQRLLFGVLTLVILVPFGLRSGWGLRGPLDGTGLFGALRIYASRWYFNGGLYPWLEQLAKRLEFQSPSLAAKAAALVLMAALMAVLFNWTRGERSPRRLLRLSASPFMAYLLLTPTVHPWYALTIMILLPFLSPGDDEPPLFWRYLLPWLYLSWALSLSYIAYLDPDIFQERSWVRLVEWVPTLLLLLASWRSNRRFARQESGHAAE